jgi:hypothetical protein
MTTGSGVFSPAANSLFRIGELFVPALGTLGSDWLTMAVSRDGIVGRNVVLNLRNFNDLGSCQVTSNW